MLVMHGAGWLAMKLEPGPVQFRARRFGVAAAGAAFFLFAAGGAVVAWGGLGFRMAEMVDTGGPSNPHLARAVAAPGAWLANFAKHHWMMAAPVLGLFGPLLAFAGLRMRIDALAFCGSSLAVAGIIATVGLSMFPFILPSSIDPASSLTVWNASSSHLTLFIMLVVVLVFLPIVLAYTTWAYRVMFGRVGAEEVRLNPDMY
jgi:cytochrome d ubiquinol oxidase subunit II